MSIHFLLEDNHWGLIARLEQKILWTGGMVARTHNEHAVSVKFALNHLNLSSLGALGSVLKAFKYFLE